MNYARYTSRVGNALVINNNNNESLYTSNSMRYKKQIELIINLKIE